MWENNSPFYQTPEKPEVPVSQDRVVEATENVQIPQGVLEDWVTSLELAENEGDVRDITLQMRSYFRG